MKSHRLPLSRVASVWRLESCQEENGDVEGGVAGRGGVLALRPAAARLPGCPARLQSRQSVARRQTSAHRGRLRERAERAERAEQAPRRHLALRAASGLVRQCPSAVSVRDASARVSGHQSVRGRQWPADRGHGRHGGLQEQAQVARAARRHPRNTSGVRRHHRRRHGQQVHDVRGRRAGRPAGPGPRPGRSREVAK